MKLFISFFVALGFTITFANGVPVSCGNSVKYDTAKIKENIDKAICVVQAQEQAKKSGQNFIVSILNDLIIFLKTTTDPQIIGFANTLPYLEFTIAGLLNGTSDGLKHGNLVDAVLGIVGGLASGSTTGFQYVGAKIAIDTLKGRDPKDNACIAKYIYLAYKFALAKRDAENKGLSTKDAALNKVCTAVNLYVRFAIGLIGIYTCSAVKSGAQGTTGGLTEVLAQHDLIGGLIDTVRGTGDGLAEGARSGFGDFIISLFTLSEQ